MNGTVLVLVLVLELELELDRVPKQMLAGRGSEKKTRPWTAARVSSFFRPPPPARGLPGWMW